MPAGGSGGAYHSLSRETIPWYSYAKKRKAPVGASVGTEVNQGLLSAATTRPQYMCPLFKSLIAISTTEAMFTLRLQTPHKKTS